MCKCLPSTSHHPSFPLPPSSMKRHRTRHALRTWCRPTCATRGCWKRLCRISMPRESPTTEVASSSPLSSLHRWNVVYCVWQVWWNVCVSVCLTRVCVCVWWMEGRGVPLKYAKSWWNPVKSTQQCDVITVHFIYQFNTIMQLMMERRTCQQCSCEEQGYVDLLWWLQDITDFGLCRSSYHFLQELHIFIYFFVNKACYLSPSLL